MCFGGGPPRRLALPAACPPSTTFHRRDKARYNPRAMSVELLDETMKAQLALEWDRLRKALSQAGDTGDLNLKEVRVVADRDRRGLPPAVSVAAVQGALKLEKSRRRVQPFRGGEETKDPTMRVAGKA